MLSVFLDANVIYSITLTDILLTLAEHDLFLPLWSPNVLQEAQEAASRTLPDAAQQAFRKRLIMMDQAFPESSIHVENRNGANSICLTRMIVMYLRLRHRDKQTHWPRAISRIFPRNCLTLSPFRSSRQMICSVYYLDEIRKPQLAPYVSLSILDIGHR